MAIEGIVPERNRAIKKLLTELYGKEHGISVTAGTGTAYHWVTVKFKTTPAEIKPFCGKYHLVSHHLEAVIQAAGIQLSSWTDDMGDKRICLAIVMPRAGQ